MPKIRIASMTRVVAMGRRMNSPAMFMTLPLPPPARGPDSPPPPHPVAATCSPPPAARPPPPRAGLDREVGLDEEDERPRLPGLHGGGGDHDRARFGAQGQPRVHELPRPEALLPVGEGGLELDRSRAPVHGVVHEGELAPQGTRLLPRDHGAYRQPAGEEGGPQFGNPLLVT